MNSKKIFFLLLLFNLVALSVHFIAPNEPTVVSLSLPADVKKLQLVSERGGAGQDRTASRGSLSIAKPSFSASNTSDKSPLSSKQRFAASHLKHCYTLGPFNTGSELLKTVIDQLGELGQLEGQRESEERELRGYRVYIPALPTREQAIAVAKQLAEKGVKDYYVSLEENYKNAVPLGVFRSKKSAQQRQRNMLALGFDVRMDPIFRKRKIIWLDYSLRRGIAQAAESALLASLKSNGIERLSRKCQ